MLLTDILTLEPHGADTYVGLGPRYPWGGLYGGQIVAQALIAAADTVEDDLDAHSLRAYFIRRGDHDEPVRYEVDRIRNGRSFATRRVVARQATGAILNLEASFQRAERSDDVDAIVPDPALSNPQGLTDSGWSPTFERRFISEPDEATDPAGRARAWLKTTERLGGDSVLHSAALAYLSDDLPTDAVLRAHPLSDRESPQTLEGAIFTASLDHTMWFHRPFRADEWHLHDFTCHTFTAGRGLAYGRISDSGGTHVATVAQEVLLRDTREMANSRASE